MTFKPFKPLNSCEFCSKENLPVYHPQGFVCFNRVQTLEKRIEELEKKSEYCSHCHLRFAQQEKAVSYQGKSYHPACLESKLRKEAKS